MIKRLTLLTLCLSTLAQAKDFGKEGVAYPIKEENMLEWIMRKLNHMEKTGEIEKMQEAFKERALEKIKRPQPVEGLRHTTEPREFFYDPSITLTDNILSHDGQELYPAGTRVNPLDKVSFNQTYLFIDGDAPEQVDWALNHPASNKKIILTSGSIIDLMNTHGIRLYFDQQGALTRKFGIQQVPAQVSQFGKFLRVKEVLL